MKKGFSFSERNLTEMFKFFDENIYLSGEKLKFFDRKHNQIREFDEEQINLYSKRIKTIEVKFLKLYIHESHSFLTKINLSSNQIGPGGGEVLAEILQHHSCLIKELFLNNNFLDNRGVVSIAKALEKNTSLESLKIGGNLVRDEGALSVAKMMTVNSTLRALEFDENKYTVNGLEALAISMNQNRNLEIVRFGKSTEIKSRLHFVKLMIKNEHKKTSKINAVLVQSKDKNNVLLDAIVAEWRYCKERGYPLTNVPKSVFSNLRQSRKLNEKDLLELHKNLIEHFNTERNQRELDIHLL